MEKFTLNAEDSNGVALTAEFETHGFPKIGERLQRGATKSFWTVTETDIANRAVFAGRPEYL